MNKETKIPNVHGRSDSKNGNLRRTGLDVIGDISWGTHFCLFYQTQEDLADILVPYFKAGLESNELCIWVTSEPLVAEDATSALKAAVNDLDDYIEKGRIEILDYSQLYTKSGVFDADTVLQWWVEKEKRAIEQGFNGLRVSGNTFWLEESDWQAFTDYESAVDSVIGQYRMLALCTYSLDKCGPAEIMDVVSNHEFALVKRENQWTAIESVDRKRAEESLRESESRFREVAEHAQDWIWEVDANGLYTYSSPSVKTMLGFEPEEVVGKKHFYDLFHAEDREEAKKAAFEIFTDNQAFRDILNRNVDKHGSTVWLSTSGVPMLDKQGRLLGYRGVDADVTERKRAGEALRASEERFRTIYENAPVLIDAFDVDGRYVLWNKHCRETFGWTIEEINSHDNPLALFYPDPAERKKVMETITTKPVGDFTEWHPVTKYGKTLTTMWANFRLPDGLAINLGIDITDRRLAEEEIAQSKESAEAANRAKSAFLANMSHEIRTPMTAILGYADLLMSHDWPPSGRREHLQVIHRQGNNLLTIIDDILDLSKIEAEQVELETMECSPFRIAEEVRSLLQVRAAEKNLDWETSFSYPLPKTIRTDPVRLRQILMNLVGNAIKFTQTGSVKTRLRLVQSKDAPAKMQFEVTDTGIGMSMEQVSSLFRPFTQADMSHTRRFGGTGLGLHISQKLAKLLGGQVEVKSEPGVGSTFTLTIDPGPLEDVEMKTPAPPLAKEEKPAKVQPIQELNGRILLAEDMEAVQVLVRLNLERHGLEVDVAENGQIAIENAAISKTEGRPYDLILMDIQMPKMDGLDATRRLRQHGWKGPIIALTAHAMNGDRKKCLDAGCDDYISKPMTAADLFDTIARHLDKPTKGLSAGTAGI